MNKDNIVLFIVPRDNPGTKPHELLFFPALNVNLMNRNEEFQKAIPIYFTMLPLKKDAEKLVNIFLPADAEKARKAREQRKAEIGLEWILFNMLTEVQKHPYARHIFGIYDGNEEDIKVLYDAFKGNVYLLKFLQDEVKEFETYKELENIRQFHIYNSTSAINNARYMIPYLCQKWGENSLKLRLEELEEEEKKQEEE